MKKICSRPPIKQVQHTQEIYLYKLIRYTKGVLYYHLYHWYHISYRIFVQVEHNALRN